jgi:phospholipase/lecithinase/hemolysin
MTSAHASFSSIYIFGDSTSTTTTNIAGPPQYYYGQRYSNGRCWVEVFAQEQGLTNNYWYSTNSMDGVSYTNLSASSTNWSYSSNNLSFYGQYSPILVTNVNNFVAPPNVSNCLFVVWVDDADFVGDMQTFGGLNDMSHGTNLTLWTNAVNSHLTNHFTAITNLYAKGVRTLVAPNAVDITEIPEFNTFAAANRAFVRQQIIDFNTAYVAMLNQIETNSPGLKIYVPDIFSLLDNILTNAAAYGLSNVLYEGQSIDAIDAYGYGILSNLDLNGPGTNYIFWDSSSATAKFHAAIAETVQQTLSPVQISRITSLNGSNQLDMANVPVGQNGFVNGSTNLVNWASVTNINSTNATETIFLPASGPLQFYQLSFPFFWSWP